MSDKESSDKPAPGVKVQKVQNPDGSTQEIRVRSIAGEALKKAAERKAKRRAAKQAKAAQAKAAQSAKTPS